MSCGVLGGSKKSKSGGGEGGRGGEGCGGGGEGGEEGKGLFDTNFAKVQEEKKKSQMNNRRYFRHLLNLMVVEEVMEEPINEKELVLARVKVEISQEPIWLNKNSQDH